MADGTHMRQFEAQLPQVNATVSDLQACVDSLEAGSSRNHDVILSLDQKFEASMNGLARRLDGFMLMFSKMPQVSLPTDFPPKEQPEPILQGNGTNLRTAGSSELEIEPMEENVVERTVERRQEARAASNQPYFPLPKLEILMFDCRNLRWWVRWCQKVFSLYNIPDQQRITLAYACLNDVVDVWFQAWIRLRDNCQ